MRPKAPIAKEDGRRPDRPRDRAKSTTRDFPRPKTIPARVLSAVLTPPTPNLPSNRRWAFQEASSFPRPATLFVAPRGVSATPSDRPPAHRNTRMHTNMRRTPLIEYRVAVAQPSQRKDLLRKRPTKTEPTSVDYSVQRFGRGGRRKHVVHTTELAEIPAAKCGQYHNTAIARRQLGRNLAGWQGSQRLLLSRDLHPKRWAHMWRMLKCARTSKPCKGIVATRWPSVTEQRTTVHRNTTKTREFRPSSSA